VAHTCHPNAAGNIKNRSVEASLGKKHDPLSKITTAEKDLEACLKQESTYLATAKP
jgi:hypothetical protein